MGRKLRRKWELRRLGLLKLFVSGERQRKIDEQVKLGHPRWATLVRKTDHA